MRGIAQRPRAPLMPSSLHCAWPGQRRALSKLPVENLGQNLGHWFPVQLNFKKPKLPHGGGGVCVCLRHLQFPYRWYFSPEEARREMCSEVEGRVLQDWEAGPRWGRSITNLLVSSA